MRCRNLLPWCCSVLQRVAACCSVLQRVAACRSVSQRVAACCSKYSTFLLISVSCVALPTILVLQRVAACCSVLQRVAACCSVLQRVAACCNVCMRGNDFVWKGLSLFMCACVQVCMKWRDYWYVCSPHCYDAFICVTWLIHICDILHARLRARVCLFVCACVYERAWVCVCVCVCVPTLALFPSKIR